MFEQFVTHRRYIISFLTRIIRMNNDDFHTYNVSFELCIYSLTSKGGYRQISRSLETAILSDILIALLCNLTGIAAAEVPVKLQSDCKRKSKVESRGFETSRDLAIRRSSARWIEGLLKLWSRLIAYYIMRPGNCDPSVRNVIFGSLVIVFTHGNFTNGPVRNAIFRGPIDLVPPDDKIGMHLSYYN